MTRSRGALPPVIRAAEAPPRNAEVIVVGAGPAGSAAAITLARGGVDVLLLDRSAFPRPKPCGDCLSPGATPMLARLGALRAVRAADPAELSGWRLRSPGGARLEMPFPGGARALALDRAALDAALLERARAEGARVRTGLRVTDLIGAARNGVAGVRARGDDGSTVDLGARFVIGADGLRSTVAARLGASLRPPRLRKVSFTWHVPVTVPGRGPAAYGELRLGRGTCLGMAPVRREGGGSPAWNVTVVFHADRWGRPGRSARRTYLRARVEELAGEDVRFDWSGAPDQLVSGPFDRPVAAVSGPGWALVGDAAGYYDPFTGQGIFQALAGGESLAARLIEALRRSVEHGPRVQGWAAHHARLTRAPRRLQRLIEAVVSRPALCDFTFDRLAASRDLTAALGAVTGDLRPANTLTRPGLLLGALKDLCAPARPETHDHDR